MALEGPGQRNGRCLEDTRVCCLSHGEGEIARCAQWADVHGPFHGAPAKDAQDTTPCSPFPPGGTGGGGEGGGGGGGDASAARVVSLARPCTSPAPETGHERIHV